MENEIFFNKEKIGGPSPRVGSPSGAMVHGGQRAGARPGLTSEHAWHPHATPKLAMRAAMASGGLMRPGDNETKWQRTELGATANRARRRGEKESAR
jgi:hypothetical protein